MIQRSWGYQLLHGKLPDVSRLRVFGSTAFVHVERSLRRKWDPKARQGVYLGLVPGGKADYVYLPDTNKIVQTMHVVWVAHVMRAAMRPSNPA